MKFTEEQVEWIVVEVLRRLGAPGVAGRERSSTSADGELVVTDRVISLRAIDGRLVGVKRLVVPRQAVITPAAKDELKQRQIEVVREAQP
jgi:hypothetical protein